MINDGDAYLYNFSNKFLNKKSIYTQNYGDEIKLTQERIVGSYCSDFLKQNFTSIIFWAEELPIYLNKKNKSYQSAFHVEIDNKSNKTWNYCVVDCFMTIDKLLNDSLVDIFIEYKMDSKFEFIKLAEDFLKYKILTSKSNNQTIFCYINFKKDEKYPGVITKSADYSKVIFLDKILKESSLKKSHVYLYIPKYNVTERIDINPPIPTTLISNVTRICKIASLIEELDIVNCKQFSKLDYYFLEKYTKYNVNVIHSNDIRNNYDYIMNLWDKANELGLFKDIIKEYNGDTNEETIKEDFDIIDKIINEGSSYSLFFEQNLRRDDKLIAVNKGLKVSTYSTLNLLVVLEFFKQSNNIELEEELYFKNRCIGYGKKATTIKYKDTVIPNLINQLKDIYKDNEFKKIIKLSFQLLYVLSNVLPLIYEYDLDDSIYKESDSYLLRKYNLKLFDSFNLLCKDVKYEKITKDDMNIETLIKKIDEISRKIISIYSN